MNYVQKPGEAAFGFGRIYLHSKTKIVNKNDKIMLVYTSLKTQSGLSLV